MVETIPQEVASAIDDLRNQLASLSERLAKLEHAPPPAAPVAATAPLAAVPSAPEPAAPEPDLTEEELLAISGALAAYLGCRVHIRQIRLISSHNWSQQGRVFIQASHQLHS